MGQETFADEPTFRPSVFAKLGQPCCSRWGKSEIEWLALAYVQALANGGDTWRKLSKTEVFELLTEEQRRLVHFYLEDDFYQGWFDSVSNQLTGAEGALGVCGFWNTHNIERHGLAKVRS